MDSFIARPLSVGNSNWSSNGSCLRTGWNPTIRCHLPVPVIGRCVKALNIFHSASIGFTINILRKRTERSNTQSLGMKPFLSAAFGAVLLAISNSAGAFQQSFKAYTVFPRASNSACFANVASSLLLDDLKRKDDGDEDEGDNDVIVVGEKISSSNSLKLSRPERKALERDKKEQRKNKNHRKHNFEQRASLVTPSNEGTFDLHSTRIPTLSKETSTADDVLKAIKRAQNLHDGHDIQVIARFLLEEVDTSFAYGYRGSLLARLAVAALHMQEHALARRVMAERQRNHRVGMLPMESAAIIRGLLRVHNVTDALEVLEDELALPLQVRVFWRGSFAAYFYTKTYLPLPFVLRRMELQ